MASFRSVGFNPTSKGFLQTETNNDYATLAQIFGTAMIGATNVINSQADVIGREAQAQERLNTEALQAAKYEQASLDAEVELTKQGWELETLKKNIEVNEMKSLAQEQDENLDSFIGEAGGDLRKVLVDNPGLLGPVRRKVQDALMKNQAQLDIGEFDVFIIQHPNKDVDELFSEFSAKKAESTNFQDDHEKGIYVQYMEQEYIKQKVYRTVQQAEQDRTNAIFASDKNHNSDVVLNLAAMTVQTREILSASFAEDSLMLDNSRSRPMLDSAFTKMVGDGLLDFADSNPVAALTKFHEIYPPGDAAYKRNVSYLEGVRATLEGAASNFVTATQSKISNAFKEAISASTNSATLRNVDAELEASGLPSNVITSLRLAANEKAKEFSLGDDVRASFGLEEGKPLITAAHDPAIDKIMNEGVRNGLSPSVVIPELVKSTGRITPEMVEVINLLSVTEPAEAARILDGITFAAPEKVAELLDKGTLSTRTSSLLSLRKNFGYKFEDIAAEVQGVPNTVFTQALASFNTPTKSANLVLKEGLDTWRFNDQPDYISKKFINFYKDAYIYSYAKVHNDYPGTLPKDLEALASAAAVSIIRQNYSTVKLNGQVIPYKNDATDLPASEFVAMNDLFSAALSSLEQSNSNIDYGSLRPDMYNIRVDPNNGDVIIPIIRPGTFMGTAKSYAEFVLPRNELERKNLYTKYKDTFERGKGTAAGSLARFKSLIGVTPEEKLAERKFIIGGVIRVTPNAQ